MPKRTPTYTYGNITNKGYRRIFVVDLERGNPKRGKKRLRMEHDVIWEQHNGPIPAGFDVHHKDENKLHNKIGNLELIPHEIHKLLHVGYTLKGGVWVRPCIDCGVEIVRGKSSKKRCRVCYNAFMARYRRAHGITTKRVPGKATSVYVHIPGRKEPAKPYAPRIAA